MIYTLLISVFIGIIAHELGHFFAAKRCGCGVLVFSIGFGKPIFKKMWKNTLWQICPILLGGYCALKGELDYSTSKTAFTNLRYIQKCYIALAGIAVNCLTGLSALGLDYFFKVECLFVFGWLVIMLGLSNLIVLFPGIDGSYPLLFLLEKIFGKKEGLLVINRAVEVGGFFMNLLNIYVVFYLVWCFRCDILILIINKLIMLLTFLIK